MGTLTVNPMTYGGPPAPEGPKYISTTLDFSLTGLRVAFVNFNCADYGVSSIRGIEIDNSQSNLPLYLQIQDTLELIVVKPYAVYRGPFITQGKNILTKFQQPPYLNNGGSPLPLLQIPVKFFNVELPTSMQIGMPPDQLPSHGSTITIIGAPAINSQVFSNFAGDSVLREVLLPSQFRRTFTLAMFPQGSAAGNSVYIALSRDIEVAPPAGFPVWSISCPTISVPSMFTPAMIDPNFNEYPWTQGVWLANNVTGGVNVVRTEIW